ELDVESRLHRGIERLDRVVGKALGPQGRRVDAGSLVKIAVADRIGFHLGDLVFRVAKGAQGRRHCTVDDLEVATAGQLLELHQGKVGLDTGGVAVHDEADRAGGRDNGNLGVTVAMLFAEG